MRCFITSIHSNAHLTIYDSSAYLAIINWLEGSVPNATTIQHMRSLKNLGIGAFFLTLCCHIHLISGQSSLQQIFTNTYLALLPPSSNGQSGKTQARYSRSQKKNCPLFLKSSRPSSERRTTFSSNPVHYAIYGWVNVAHLAGKPFHHFFLSMF